MIGRRHFVVTALACGGLAATHVHGQTPKRMKRVGVLAVGAAFGGMPREWAEALRAHGWVEGDTLRMERRSAPSAERLTPMAEELITLKVDLIFAVGIAAARAAAKATQTIPIVIQVGGDPVAAGLAANLSRPGGNVTGFFYGGYEDKFYELIKEVRPAARIVAFLTAPLSARTEQEAARHGLVARGVDVGTSANIDVFLAFLRSQKADAAIVQSYSWLREHSLGRIAQVALDLRIVTLGEHEDFAEAGGLMAYSSVWQPVRLAAMMDRILRGANPAETPIELPTRFRLAVNLRTAKAIGATIPVAMLHRADKVIE